MFEITFEDLLQGLERRAVLLGQLTQGEGGLESDAGRGIAGTVEERLVQAGGTWEEGFGEAQCVFADARMIIFQGAMHGRRGECVQAVQGPQGVQPCVGRGMRPGEAQKRRNDRKVLTFQEETLGGQSAPGIEIGEVLDELCGCATGGGRTGSGQSGFGCDSVDAASLLAGAEFELLAHTGWDVVGMFDDVPLHIDQVEGTVGPGFKSDGAEIDVVTGEELAVEFGGGSGGDEDGAVGMDDIAMNEVADDVADQDAAGQIARIRGVPDVSETAGGGEMAGLFGMIGAGLSDRDGMDAGHVTMIGDGMGGWHGGKASEPMQVPDRQDAKLDVVDVVRGEAAAPIVEDQPESASGNVGGFEPARTWVESEIEMAKGNGWRGQPEGLDRAAVAAIDAVDMVVEREPKSVDVAVGHTEPEPTEPDFAQVGFAIACGVLEIEDLGRGGNEDAAVPRRDGSGETEVLGEKGAEIGSAIAGAILEKPDGAAGCSIGPEAVRIIAHFDDEHASVRIETERDRIDHIRFGGEQVDLKIRMKLDGIAQRLSRVGLDESGRGERNEQNQDDARTHDARLPKGSGVGNDKG